MSLAVLIFLRLVHIVIGVFWVGAVAFIAFLLFPAIREGGPAGGAVMQRLMARGVNLWLMAAAILTVLSGLALYWHDSAGFSSTEWLGSGPGRTFGLGAVLAFIGVGIGMGVNSRAAKQLGELTARIQAAVLGDAPGGPAIIVLTAYDYPQYADAALRLGASGFVLKTAPIAELLDAIRRVAAGGLAFSVRPRASAPLGRLSERELDVVRLVVEGRSNDEIGARLGIGAKTVESHLRRLFDRFDLASRTELATRALREGWLDVPPGV